MDNQKREVPLIPGQNTGVRIDMPIRSTDFFAGGESIPFEVLEESGQYDVFLPDEESQLSVVSGIAAFDSFDCVTFSGTNDLEAYFEWLRAKGKMPTNHEQFLKDEGYIDPRTNKVNFSDRFSAKMSGTSKNGNSLPAVGDSFRKDGLIPESEWPRPSFADIAGADQYELRWQRYYAEIPQSLKDKAKRFLTMFQINYRWGALGTSTPAALKDLLRYGPFQIAAAICAPWSSTDGMPPIPACGCGTGHATVIYGYTANGAWKDFDHYKSFRKLLAADYCIPYAFQYKVTPIAQLPNTPVPFKHTYLINLTYGSTDPEVKNLQLGLQSVQNKLGQPYMKPGVFGPFGPQTAAALNSFQKDHGIIDPQPGQNFGPQSRAALTAELNK